MTTAEWNGLINEGIGELYGTLCQTYEDYNVKFVTFTLTGGSLTNNQLLVGPGQSTAQDFWQPRFVWLQVNNSPQPYVTLPRIQLIEQNLYTFPNIVPIYGAIPSGWNIVGNVIQIIPAMAPANTYQMGYVPAAPVLVNDTDTIDAFWLTVNGWQKYAIRYAAIEALLQEESGETAAPHQQKLQELKTRILMEAKPRDISQPQSIVDMQRVRNLWPTGLAGSAPGWGGDWGGSGGCW